jgi:hypothetical protein
MKGTEGSKSFRLRGLWTNQEVYMLVNFGSTNCFISEHLAAAAPGKIPLQQSGQSCQWVYAFVHS